MDILGISKVIDKALSFIPDAAQRETARQEVYKFVQTSDAYQNDVNKVEAASTNWFVAGWRPFIGWICGLGFGIQFVFGPILEWGGALFHYPISAPNIGIEPLMTCLMSMLGLGTMRTIERLNGKERK